MRIQNVSFEQINPAPYNPRKRLQRGDPEYDRLEHSLDSFGCVEPLVWNERTGHLVGGHQRFTVLRSRGATGFDVSVVDLDDQRERALNIALNKITGAWDVGKLAELLDELSSVSDFDITLTGFDVPEANDLIADVLGRETDEPEHDLPITDPITQPGELLTLGSHKLYCGDASNRVNLETLLDGNQIDLVHTDPPYNVAYDAAKRPTHQAARRASSWSPIAGDDVSRDGYRELLAATVGPVLDRLRPGGAAYIWNGHAQFGLMHELFEEHGCHASCVITWAKESFAPGFGDYNQQTEFCLYGWKDGHRHVFRGPKNASTLWDLPRDRNPVHPTQKPLALAARAIAYSSGPGELVFDPFLGSGTTLIAAERSGRRCFGFELDPRYCDVIVRRYLAAARSPEPALAERFAETVEPAGAAGVTGGAS